MKKRGRWCIALGSFDERVAVPKKSREEAKRIKIRGPVRPENHKPRTVKEIKALPRYAHVACRDAIHRDDAAELLGISVLVVEELLGAGTLKPKSYDEYTTIGEILRYAAKAHGELDEVAAPLTAAGLENVIDGIAAKCMLEQIAMLANSTGRLEVDAASALRVIADLANAATDKLSSMLGQD